jgi:L-alanine-DL-glutamate epimerase-like enolase superfamily enzyme
MKQGEAVIHRMDLYRYELSYIHGMYTMSNERTVSSLESTVVALRTADGTSGYGEVCPLGSAYLPASASGAQAALKELGPVIVGQDVSNLGALHDLMDSALAGHGYAKSPVDIAAMDLFGKLHDIPGYQLLGGRRTAEIPLYVAVPLGSVDEMVKFVVSERANGIHRFQLKLGAKPEDDVERVRAVIDATDENDTIVADANGGWRLADAVQAARLLDGLPRLRLEQPCPSLEECLQVRGRTSLPMILDEVIIDARTLVRVASAYGAEGVNLKISRVGGLTRARFMRDLCVELGMSLTIEDSWGGDLCTAAVAQLAASTGSEALYAASFMNDWTFEHVAGYQPRSSDGLGRVTDKPGLGIDVDERQFSQHLWSLTATD